jgi:histidyl-tRNA synthetase
MQHKLQPVRGTKDLIGDDYLLHKYVIDISSKIAANYGYNFLATPIFEFTDVFKRTLGETADVVTKEMYSFLDRGNESLTLRPEFTASIARCFISNGLSHNLPLKFFTTGPLFRYERPQKGRQRQFHQINMECLGIASPYMDSEVIAMAAHILSSLGVLQYTKLELNSLGDKESRVKYHLALIDYFSSYKNELSDDSKIRLEKNPLRILDSKDENDKKIIINAPFCYDYYNSESKDFFEQVTQALDQLSIDYTLNPRLVRGLDYYSHTAFEFTTDRLGAQGTVLGGGRYDGLIELMGGPKTSAIGFAAGIERLTELIDYKPSTARPIVVIATHNNMIKPANELACALRHEDFFIEISYEGDVGKKMKRANKLNAKIAIFIGEEELLQNSVKIKFLDSREEKIIALDKLIDYLAPHKN